MSPSALGSLCIWVALIVFLGGAVNEGVALSGRRALPARFVAIAGLVSVIGAVVVMQTALIGHDFSLAYVADNNATFTPLIYSMTGMWSALEGSILLWALLLALFLVVLLLSLVRFLFAGDRGLT